MAESRAAAPDAGKSPALAGELAKLYEPIESAGRGGDDAPAEALDAYLEFVDRRRVDLGDDADRVASQLDVVAAGYLKIDKVDRADRSVEVGLALAPAAAALWHRKALVRLAQGMDLGEALRSADSAIERDPHEKVYWATRGEVLARQGRSLEAAQSFLSAQRLDAASTQYVERAIELAPDLGAARRMKLELARGHGGDAQALEACDALLAQRPDDGEILFARAELLAALGRYPDSLESVEKARARGVNPAEAALLAGRVHLAVDEPDLALQEFRSCLDLEPPPDERQLAALAEVASDGNRDLELAIKARGLLAEREPRNLGNLALLRELAMRAGLLEVAVAASQATLQVSPGNLEALRALGEAYSEQGKVPEALESYRALVEAHPNASDDIRRALEIAREAGRPELSESFARAVLAESPKDAAAREELARILESRGDRTGALAAYDALLVDHPSEISYLLAKKRLLEGTEASGDLLPVLDEVFRRDPTRADIALERGNLYLEKAFDEPAGSDTREAAARAAAVSYERASLDPDRSAASLLGLARSARLLGDPERAVQAYREFLARPENARRADVHKELGHALRELHRLSEADAAYQEAIHLGLEEPDLLWGEVEVLALLDQDARALRFVELLLQREPDNPLFLRRKGQLQLKMGRRAEGLATLRQAVEGAHGDPHIHFEVGEALRSQGAYADALTYFRQGLALEPGNRSGRLAMAETLVLAGQASEAVPVVDGLLKDDPNDLLAWQTRADAYRALGRPPEVLYSLRAVLLLDPHNAAALAERYRLHLAGGERPEAAGALGQLLATGGPESRDPALWLQLGDLDSELGQAEEANRAYERAAQLDPAQRPEIALRRARLRLSAGRPDLALEVLDGAGTGEPNLSTLLLRAEILQALERPGEALAVYQEVQRREPRSPVAIAGVARCLLDQGKGSEAKEFLVAAIPKGPPQAPLFLLLAEAEAALGSLPEAVHTIKKGIEALPKSSELWVRLGEVEIARQDWPEASGAFAHAIALRPGDAVLLRRAGFVAERLGHPNEALALYDHATEVAPTDKEAWTDRGRALLAADRPEDARQSFDRALSLDSDHEAAKEGRKTSVQRTRERQISKFGREALLLEARLNRSVTRNDLFVTLHVPYDLLEPVLSGLSKDPRVDLDRLDETEFGRLEDASYQLIVSALELRPDGIERRGLTLADVAVLSPATASLSDIQRLFGYVRSVLETDLKAENLRLTPELEELARRGLLLPEHQRTLFQLVRTLRVGLYKARLIKTIEVAGTAVHAPLPAVDLGAYSPEFRAPENQEEPETAPSAAPVMPAAARSAHGHSTSPPKAVESPLPTTGVRCVGCGGVATAAHDCGAALCRQCISEYTTCPKCRESFESHPVTPIPSVPAARPPEPPSRHRPDHSAAPSSVHPKAHPARETPAPREPKPKPVASSAPPGGSPPAHPAGKASPAKSTGPKPAAEPSPTEPASTPEESPVEAKADAAAPPRPAHPKERTDDEPRL